MASPAPVPATQEDLLRAVARYHAACLRVIGSQNDALKDVRAARKAAYVCDVGVLHDTEALLAEGEAYFEAPTEATRAERPQTVNVWDRLRELEAKASLEPYAKEVVYGFPLLRGLLPGRTGKLEPVLAPLLLQAVSIDVDESGRVRVAVKDEPPRVNSVFWREYLSSSELLKVMRALGGYQKKLAGEGYSIEVVNEMLHALGAVFSHLKDFKVSGSLEEWPARESPAQAVKEQARLLVYPGAAVFLSGRSSQYLLRDLEEMGEDPAGVLLGGGPLDILLSPLSATARPAVRTPALDEVVFPFPSNDGQRRIANALEKNSLVVVEGPPGTGKSLTIANLVAHLVAQGKRVLVTSHKQQALSVVRDKLSEMKDLHFLYAFLGDGLDKKMATQIAGVKHFAAMAKVDLLQTQLRTIEAERTRRGREYSLLRDEFLSRADPEQGRAEELYPKLRARPTLPVEDPALPAAEHQDAAQALMLLDQMAREHLEAWPMLTASSLADQEDLGAVKEALAAFLDAQKGRIDAARNPQVTRLIEEWQLSDIARADSGDEKIEEALAVLKDLEVLLLPALKELEVRPDRHKLAPTILNLRVSGPGASPALEDRLRTAEVALATVKQHAPSRRRLSILPRRRVELLGHLEQAKKLLGGKQSKQWLQENEPSASALPREALEGWMAFWEAWDLFRDTIAALPGALRRQLPEDYDPQAATEVVHDLRASIALAKALDEAADLREGLAAKIPLEEAVVKGSQRHLQESAEEWRSALQSARHDSAGNRLKEVPALMPLQGPVFALDDLLDRGNFADGETEALGLESLLAALDSLESRRRLLDGPLAALPASVRAVEDAVAAGSPPPRFLDSLEEALSCHEQVLEFNELLKNRDTARIAEELSQLREEIMEDARALLKLRIQSRVMDNLTRPIFLGGLSSFQSAVVAPKGRQAFHKLKRDPAFDYRVLTDVFPCWIMRPDDVCRIFPLEADLFDVVIFDEASQCNPDQALPLLARANKALVFGDEKQLANEDLRRSLSGVENQVLLDLTGLETLDPAGIFDQLRHSLLGLVSKRQQAAQPLNEHFRCRPELIAFSNHNFYGDGLQVMRDRSDDAGLGSPLLVFEVTNPQSRRKSKVNQSEARALVEELKQRLHDPRYLGLSFGVLSLFREQTDHLQELIEREIDPQLRKQHHLICSTVDGFQGDERDVIFYSWRYSSASPPGMFNFVQGADGERRLNVALTRARHQALHFISAPVRSFPQGASLTRSFLEHALTPDLLMSQAAGSVYRHPTSQARQILKQTLGQAGYRVEEEYLAGGVAVDLMVMDPASRRKVVVLVDAGPDPYAPATAPDRLEVQSQLERTGWKVLRYPATRVFTLNGAVIEEVRRSLDDAPTRHTFDFTEVSEETHRLVEVDPALVEVLPEDEDEEVDVEDRSDYDWQPLSVSERQALGEDVFQSDFERNLYDLLAREEGIEVVPQWPARGRFIDLVVTDAEGRRLAVEADGEIFHETDEGQLIPEDIWRQKFLEEAGWVFHRVRYSDFQVNPEGEAADVLKHLGSLPPNDLLSKRERTARGEASKELVKAATLPDETDLAEALDELEAFVFEDERGEDASEGLESGAREALREDLLADVASPEDAAPLDLLEEELLQRAEEDLEEDPGILALLSELDLVLSPQEEEEETDALQSSPAFSDHPAHSMAGDREEFTGLRFDRLPIEVVPRLIGAIVLESLRVEEQELRPLFSRAFEIEVPSYYHGLFEEFVQTSHRRGYVDFEGRDEVWVGGARKPAPLDCGGWCLAALRVEARRSLEQGRSGEAVARELIQVIGGGAPVPQMAGLLVVHAVRQAGQPQRPAA